MSRLSLKGLLSNGYFTEELPPPFHSTLIGQNIKKVLGVISRLPKLETQKLAETDYVRFSIPKVGLHRRVNGIPNPYHFILLAQKISQNWKDINRHYKKSKHSSSIPIIDSSGTRAIVQLARFEEFQETCIESSFNAYYELKTDIAKYFPSIYTHSIPWALHTKSIAKRKRRDSSLLGNQLDAYIRYGQSGQTIGLPIGTDTSRIVAEIIGCSMDEYLEKELANESIELIGKRFVDDCHYFFKTRSDAEIALKHFQKILIDFSLNINETKTFINEAPFCFDNNWNQTIIDFKLRKDPSLQRFDLRSYFNIVINLSKKFPSESVIKYAIKKFRNFKIDFSNWSIYESFLYSLVIAEGSILPDFLTILMQNSKAVNRKKLESVIHSLITKHVNRGNHFEVSWSLWIAKSFSIKISKSMSNAILNSKDIASILILLDLRNNKLSPNSLHLSSILTEFNQDGLKNEYWLLVYEAIHKGWVVSPALSTIKFFEEISNIGISFYDINKQVSIGNPNISGYATRFKVKTPNKKAGDEEGEIKRKY